MADGMPSLAEFVKQLVAMRDGVVFGIKPNGDDKPYGPGHPWTDVCKAADKIIGFYQQGRWAFLRGYPRECNPQGDNEWDNRQDGIEWLKGWDDAANGKYHRDGPGHPNITEEATAILRWELAALFILWRDDYNAAKNSARLTLGNEPAHTPEQTKALFRRLSSVLDKHEPLQPALRGVNRETVKECLAKDNAKNGKTPIRTPATRYREETGRAVWDRESLGLVYDKDYVHWLEKQLCPTPEHLSQTD